MTTRTHIRCSSNKTHNATKCKERELPSESPEECIRTYHEYDAEPAISTADELGELRLVVEGFAV
jgi:hypothetical protein